MNVRAMRWGLSLALGAALWTTATMGDEVVLPRWDQRYGFEDPALAPNRPFYGVAEGRVGELPSLCVTPSGTGRQLVRASIPFPPAAFPQYGVTLKAECNGVELYPTVRVLTLHPGEPRSVRRAMLTFPFAFNDTSTHTFRLSLAEPPNVSSDIHRIRAAGADDRGNYITAYLGDRVVTVRPTEVVAQDRQGAQLWKATLEAPSMAAPYGGTAETVEAGPDYVWVRILQPDSLWPRIVEARIDSLGAVTIQAHLQRLEPGDANSVPFGWRITGFPLNAQSHRFADGQPFEARSADGRWAVAFPVAHRDRAGEVQITESDLTFLRSRVDELTPFQSTAWRRAAFVVGSPGSVERTALLEPPSRVEVDPEVYCRAYDLTRLPDLSPWPVLNDLRNYTLDAIKRSMCEGIDFGNVTAFVEGQPAPVYGMNRLNHGPAIFQEAWRASDPELRDVAVLWCSNMHDLSLWWGEDNDFGGTRYNNAPAAGDKTHEGDPNYMWRTNNASTFCTKGIDAFYLAYEETGDPRYLAALRAQVGYAKRNVHALPETTRNIGDVADFLNLYRWTGDAHYRAEALRLFQELRTTLSTGDLFTESGKPITPDPPFIDEDQQGYLNPFAKPYIIGYALAGLPELLSHYPEEEKLRDVVRAVADFMASSQDPTGGWRYPHPASTRVLLNQSIEHAAQVARAAAALEARGEDIAALVDAVERTLQARVAGFARTGTILAGLAGWEHNPGAIPEGKTIYDLYAKPADRDPSRDYTEGAVSIGSAPPEGLVYFGEVLAFYLKHRPAERLFHTNDKLRAVVDRAPERRPQSAMLDTAALPAPETYGMRAHLPTFAAARVARMDFPLAWPVEGLGFDAWRQQARAFYIECLQTPPPRARFNTQVLATEDRGSYEARKLALNISTDSRIGAYLLVPKGEGPFPAVLALHDHGAHFSIGKEKVVRPFDVPDERMRDAQEWVAKYYGGNWIGDELAKRGYVVLAIDALFWGDRGRHEGVEYSEQQALAANLLQLGMSWAGNIVWDDIRSAEYLQSLPEVDPQRIACMGLSMGAHRTWNLCAATDIVKAGAAICWMGDTPTLMAEGNNQTVGQSSFSMTFPGLRNRLDYPDVASIACPKPMLFYNGTEDGLFPVPGVEACYAKMRKVWSSQNADDRLETRLWPVPHEFNAEMQEATFAWLDRWMKE